MVIGNKKRKSLLLFFTFIKSPKFFTQTN